MSQSRMISFLFLIAIILGIRFAFAFREHKQYTNGQLLEFTTTLFSEPTATGKLQHFVVVTPNNSHIFVTTARFPEYHYGQTVVIKGVIKMPNQKNTNMLVMSFPKITLQPGVFGVFTPFLEGITRLRQFIVRVFASTLSPISASLLLGIVFGIKENMPQAFKDNLRLVGLLHVIAASGMNVTMVAAAMTGMLGHFLRRQFALLLSILAIVFYAVFSGLEPSILRAAIMGVLALTAQLLGRQHMPFYALFLAGSLMLFISPVLLFDIGFQLSFLSSLGLLVIQPVFAKQKQLHTTIQKFPLLEDAMTSFACQLATIPILLSNFGSYALISLLVNFLVLWTVPPLMMLGGLAGITSFLFVPVSKLFLYVALPILWYFEEVVSLFAKTSFLIKLTSFPIAFTIGYYFLLASLLIYFHTKQNKQ